MFTKESYITGKAIEWLLYFYPKALIKYEIDEQVKNWFGDYILSFINPIILPMWLINRALKGAINWHTSLPSYPGTGGYSMALLNEDKWAGITVHLMDEKIDHGKIIEVIPFRIPLDCTIESLLQESHEKALYHFINYVQYVIPGWGKKKDYKKKDMPYTCDNCNKPIKGAAYTSHEHYFCKVCHIGGQI